MNPKLLGRRVAMGGAGMLIVGGLVAGVPGTASADTEVASTSVGAQQVVARAQANIRIEASRNRLRVGGWARDYTSGNDKVQLRVCLQRKDGSAWKNVVCKPGPQTFKTGTNYVELYIPGKTTYRGCTNGKYYRAVVNWKWNGRTGPVVRTKQGQC